MTLKKQAVLYSRRSPQNLVALGALQNTFLFIDEGDVCYGRVRYVPFPSPNSGGGKKGGPEKRQAEGERYRESKQG